MTVITEKELNMLLTNEGLDTETLQDKVVSELCNKGKRVATAESCTGGLISEAITRVSGSSEVFDCGVCSYSNEIKHRLLGVKNETLKAYGAVSYQTATEMARGVRLLSGADIGVSTTGIAGPTGGTKDKPVGLVYMGISTGGFDYAVKLDFSSAAGKSDSRIKIRRLACAAVLYTVLQEIAKES